MTKNRQSSGKKEENKNKLALIRERLIKTFSPVYLSLKDESRQHIGHAGALSGGGHYALEISAEVFGKKDLLSCHRLVYQSLEDLMQKDIHALKIKLIYT